MHRSAQHRLPLVLVEKKANQLIVSRATPELRLAGITEGMPLTLARAMQPDIRIKRFLPTQDFEALYQLALWAIKFTPLVSIDTDLARAYQKKLLAETSQRFTGLVLDVTGTERIHKGEAALINRLSAAFKKHNLSARLAIAPTVGAAWALSRFSHSLPCYAHSTELKAALHDLPVAGLRISPETIDRLTEVGIASIGELWALPIKTLLQRFGPQIIIRLDQLLGRSAEPLATVKPTPLFTSTQEFEFPLAKLESVIEACLKMLAVIFGKLSSQKKKAGFFLFELNGITNHGEKWQLDKDLTLAAASKNTKHLAALLHFAFEQLRLPGPVFSINITAQSTEPTFAWQKDFINESAGELPPEVAEELVNNYVVRLGRENVLSLSFNQSYIPERSFTYVTKTASAKAPVDAWTKPERPPYLLAEPEEIFTISLLPDSPPSQIQWAGQSYKIAQGLGPERISAEWWRGDLAEALGSRDYFRVQDDLGRWLWVFRDNKQQKWFVQGIWA